MSSRIRHPGVELATTFEGMTQDTVADALGITRQTVNRLYRGRQAITPEMSMRLEQVTGRSAEDWLVMQVKYELNKLRDELAHGAGPLVGARSRPVKARVVSAGKQAARLKDLHDLKAGVSPAVLQARNAAFDGRRYRIKPRAFKG